MSKGSKRRPEDRKKIDSNWERIFNKSAGEKKPDVKSRAKGERPSGHPKCTN